MVLYACLGALTSLQAVFLFMHITTIGSAETKPGRPRETTRLDQR